MIFFFVSVILETLRSLKSTNLHNPHQLKGFCFSIMKGFSKRSQFTEKKILWIVGAQLYGEQPFPHLADKRVHEGTASQIQQ